jgi:hypothetical protein
VDRHNPLAVYRQEQVMRTLAAGVAADAQESSDGTFATIEHAAEWARDLRKRIGSYLPGPAQEGRSNPPAHRRRRPSRPPRRAGSTATLGSR